MARIRTVKPELFRHEALFELEQETGLPVRLAFIGLFTCCDREGRFKWRPRALQLDVLPYDGNNFDRVLEALVRGGLVVHYEVDGAQFGCIPSFAKHQVINQREAKSVIPGPDDGSMCTHMHAPTQAGEGIFNGVNIPESVRDTIFARDGRVCTRCSATDDLTIDHIFPRSIGGTHAITNLRVLCRPCNSSRPVQGQGLIDDLAKDGLTLGDMQRMCTHMHEPVHAHGEGKGREGKGREGEGKGTTLSSRSGPTACETVFAHWVKVMGKNAQTLFTKDRKAKVQARLKEGYTPEQLCRAIDGCARTPHNMGQNDRGELYNDLELICRTGSQVDRFIGNAGRESKQEREQRELDAWLADGHLPGVHPANTIDGEYEHEPF